MTTSPSFRFHKSSSHSFPPHLLLLYVLAACHSGTKSEALASAMEGHFEHSHVHMTPGAYLGFPGAGSMQIPLTTTSQVDMES